MAESMQLIVPGDATRVPLQVVVLFSASVGAVRFLWRVLRRGLSEEAEQPRNANGATKQLWKLYAETWDENCRWDPISATMNGDHRYDHKLKDLSHDAWKNHVKKLQEIERKMLKINFKELESEREQDNYTYLKENLRLELRAMETFERYELPANHLFGPQILIAQLPAIQRISNGKEARDFIQRLRGFDAQTNQMIEALRAGLKSGHVLHLQAIQTMIQQCQEQAVDSYTESGLYHMMAARVQTVGGNVDQLKSAIEESVIPSYSRLRHFLRDTYVWEARKEPGVWSLPDGDDFYQGCLEYFTSLDLTPLELHELGLAEVRRISEKIKRTRAKLEENSEDDNATFIQAMNNDPKSFYEHPEEIVQCYQKIIDRADEALPMFFSTIPEAPLVVRKIDDSQAAFAPPAHYHPASPKDKMPAIFFANTSSKGVRPRYQMQAIALHEGIPGHHIQLGLAQGWALYGESLGEEMGLYHTPLDYLGRLSTEIWRATRLVVDTGIHNMHWPREKAITYMKQNAFLSDADVLTELDRIVTMPGQAVAYKVGERRLLELKDHAQRKLEANFSWQAFHEVVLRAGTVPLSMVGGNVVQWVSSERRKGRRDRLSYGDGFRGPLESSLRQPSMSSDGSGARSYRL